MRMIAFCHTDPFNFNLGPPVLNQIEINAYLTHGDNTMSTSKNQISRHRTERACRHTGHRRRRLPRRRKRRDGFYRRSNRQGPGVYRAQHPGGPDLRQLQPLPGRHRCQRWLSHLPRQGCCRRRLVQILGCEGLKGKMQREKPASVAGFFLTIILSKDQGVSVSAPV